MAKFKIAGISGSFQMYARRHPSTSRLSWLFSLNLLLLPFPLPQIDVRLIVFGDSGTGNTGEFFEIELNDTSNETKYQ